MATIPRKLLIVKRPPPSTGWNVMWEGSDDSTHSYQVPDHIGERAILEAIDAIARIVVQSGIHAIGMRRPKNG